MRTPANFPDYYKDIVDADPVPRHLEIMIYLYGLKESPGAANNPEILEWAQELGGAIGGFYHDDSIPWCGLTVAICLKRAGMAVPAGFDAIRALEYAKYGDPIQKPCLGDILIFQREGGGHVGLYMGEDDDCFHVLGGNQHDEVCITRIDKSRLFAARRPSYGTPLPSVKRIFLQPDGSPTSQNES